MKKQLTVLAILLSALITGNCFAQGVGINNPTPAASALLDLTSSSKGFLAPRMTTAQRTAITSPATGLLVYDTSLNQFYYFDGTSWLPFVSSTTGWGVSGNAGTNSISNFIGTTDAADFVIKTNGAEKLRVSFANALLPGNSNTIDLGSSAKGFKDIYATGTVKLDGFTFVDNKGTACTWLGQTNNSANTGIFNTMVGSSAGQANTSGTANTFMGTSSGQANTTGGQNTFIGSGSGQANSSGSFNTFLGNGTGLTNSTGAGNTFVGYLVGNANTTASGNTFMGQYSGFVNTTGYQNAFYGGTSGNANITGTGNTFLGYGSGYDNIDGNQNTYLGQSAGAKNVHGNNNVCIGSGSGVGAWAPCNYTNDIFIGVAAGFRNNTGSQNIFMGMGSGSNNISGSQNVIIGDSSGLGTTGNRNCVMGTYAGPSGNSSNNVCIGNASGLAMVGNDNIIIGDSSGYGGSGSRSIIIGKNANTVGTDNTVIGSNASAGAMTTNASAIGANARVTQSNSMVLGNNVNIGIGTSAPQTSLDVNGGVSIEDTAIFCSGNMTLTVGNRSYIRISSSALVASSVLTLSNGLHTGQLLIIECTSTLPSYGLRIADNAALNNTNMNATRDLYKDDNVTLIWNGTDWIELNYSDN